jgi:flagellar export protein FliJ
MKPFTFRLATLLRIRQSTRDERRMELAQAYQAMNILDQNAADLRDQFAAALDDARRAAGVGRIDVDRLSDANRRQMAAMAEQREVEKQRAILQVEIERRRDALMLADRQVRVLERLRESQLERHEQEFRRLEGKMLDQFVVDRPRPEEEQPWPA